MGLQLGWLLYSDSIWLSCEDDQLGRAAGMGGG